METRKDKYSRLPQREFHLPEDTKFLVDSPAHRECQWRSYCLKTVWLCLVSTALFASCLAFHTITNYRGPSSETLLPYSGLDGPPSLEGAPRRKRELAETARMKEEAEEAIMRLMREPGCKADCQRLANQLKGLGTTIDLTMEKMAGLRAEIRRVAKGCANTTVEEEDDGELQLDMGLHHRTGEELEELNGRAASGPAIDHDLEASDVYEVRYPPPPTWGGYPWPPARSGPLLSRQHIPPTGPDSAGSLGGVEPTGSGPGEVIHTSQQMSVSLPQRLERVCSVVPGPPGSSGYLCSPVRDLVGPQTHQQPERGQFYLQVLGKSQTHVPTAISTPNPYAFPTLSGSPVIVPASAAAPGQLMPVYNPINGRIMFQNFQQTVPVYNPNQQQQFPGPLPQEDEHQYGSPSPQQPFSIPFPPYVIAQYATQPGYGASSQPNSQPEYSIPPPAGSQNGYGAGSPVFGQSGYSIPVPAGSQPGYGTGSPASGQSGYSIPVPTGSQPGYGAGSPVFGQSGYSIPVPAGSQPGYGTGSPASGQSGYSIPVPAGSQPGYGTGSPASGQSGYSIPVPASSQPGYGTGSPASGQSGYSIPVPASSQPGYGTGSPASGQSGYSIPVPASSQPGYGTGSPASGQSGYSIPVPASSQPGYGTGSPASGQSGYSIPVPASSQPGYGTGSPASGQSGYSIPVPASSQPGYGTGSPASGQSGYSIPFPGTSQVQSFPKPQFIYQPPQQQFLPASFSPPVYIPPSPNQPSSDRLQCAYVIVPNSPAQTYKFPPVPGVSETIQRSGVPLKGTAENNGITNKNIDKNINEKNDKGIKLDKSNSTSPKFNKYVPNCSPGTRSCSDGSKCVEWHEWCDSKVDCLDSSDEVFCSCKERILPEKYCDGYFDCPRGEDELGCSGCQDKMFSCYNIDDEEPEEICLPLEKRCDSVRDCRNGKDEVDCNLISDQPKLNEVSIVSYSEGYLYRNWKGRWYPVCSTTSWALEACSTEIGPLIGVPQMKLSPLREKYNGLFAAEFGKSIQLTECMGTIPGSALWVTCPIPDCGIKLSSGSGHRSKRESPPTQYTYHYVDKYPHTEEPSFQNTPEAMEFVKNFFNSASVFDRKKFYKRLWGPLTEPYMGVNDSVDGNQPSEGESGPRLTSDPSQMSWQQYLRPYQQTIDSFNPENFFPNYQDAIQYGGLNPHDMVPVESYNYQNYASQYLDNYEEPYLSPSYMKNVRNIEEEERLKREEMMRVVGGSKSKPGAWPWLVVLYRDGEFHCGGSILTPSVILTAAHCINRFEDHYYEVHAGLLRRLSFSPQEQIRLVDQVVRHENYDQKTMVNDIALLKLTQPLKFNRWVLPICLPPREDLGQAPYPQTGTLCTAVGWGAVFEHGPDPDHLREVEVPVLPSCTHRVDRLGNEICAGYPEGGMDTCQGDSGGPLLCRTANNRWYVGGIVSHGEGCARLGEPGVYTRVSLYKDWIQTQLLWAVGSSKSSRKSCPGFTCKSGRCLSKKQHCNSHVDCFDGEDELNCHINLPEGRSAASEKGTLGTEESGGHFDYKLLPAIDQTTTETLPLVTNIQTSSVDITPPTTIGVNQEETTIQPITEGPVIFSLQTQSVNFTDLFTCKRLTQRIILSRVCDDIVDCEDGTDEKGCSCKDRLKHLAPKLLCNGVVDCRDLTDEEDCPALCPEDKYYCRKSKICLPRAARCDGRNDCHFGEDEDGCYALIGDEIRQDPQGRPALLLSGTAAVLSQGEWRPMCVRSDPEPVAALVCNNMGFRLTKDVRLLNTSELSVEVDGGTCSGLHATCSSPINKLWTAPLFKSGLPLTLGVLVTENWILVPTMGLKFHDSKVFLNTWLGKENLTLNVLGVYDQFIRINGIENFGDGEVTLLHLEEPAKISHLVVPLGLSDWPTPPNENEMCEAVGMTSLGKIFTVGLSPVICKEGFRCYDLLEHNPSICDVVGVVICHSDYGPYLTSVLSGDLCKTQFLELRDLSKERKNITNAIENGGYDILEEDICESVRCEHGNCLDWLRIGDGISDCFDSRDESADLWKVKEQHCKDFQEGCNCRPGEMRCPGSECIDAQKFCDQRVDCSSGSDEGKCDCLSYLSLARPHQLCDGIANCFNKADETWALCSNRTDCSAPGRFPCDKSGGCIPSSFTCDGEDDCPNAEDEVMCIAIRSPPTKPKEGLLFTRMYGELIPQCVQPDDGLEERVCSVWGGKGVKASHFSKVSYSYVLTDVFTRVRLHPDMSLSIRPDRKFASAQQSPNKTCSAMYIECE